MKLNFLDYRHVYLLRYGRTSKYKIGIAKNVENRRKQVDGALPEKRVKKVFSMPLFFAERNEQKLHGHYSDSRYFFKKIGKKGGKTEWFKLNGLEVFAVQVQLILMVVIQFSMIVSISLLILILSYVKYFT